jgi:2-dehydropantoate 2-reductase
MAWVISPSIKRNLTSLNSPTGIIDEARALFPKSSSPSYLAAITNHGVYSTGFFSSVHAGIVDMTIGRVLLPHSTELEATPARSDYLTNLVLSSATLKAKKVPPGELLRVQLRKLTVNAVINPLTAIFDCLNGELFTNDKYASIAQALTMEISRVVMAILMADDANDEDIQEFGFEKLFQAVQDVGHRAANNISSMRQDVLAGRPTEIEYINGYVVRRGEEFGLSCPINHDLVRILREYNADVKNMQH